MITNEAYMGGASKLPAILGAATELESLGVIPNNIVGSSAGGIVALFRGVGKLDITEFVFAIKAKQVFKSIPFKEDGGLTLSAKYRLITGELSMGNQLNLKESIKKNISEQEFNVFLKDESRPNVYIACTNLRTKKIKYFNLKKFDYNTAIDIVYASTCIPLITDGQVINGETYHDGGIIDNIGSHFLLKRHKCDRLISIYSRMADYEEDEYNPKNALHVLFRLIETMHENMGRDDEGRADDFCLRRKIKNDKIFMPSTLMTEIFKFDYDLNRAMFEIGRASARQVIAINP